MIYSYSHSFGSKPNNDYLTQLTQASLNKEDKLQSNSKYSTDYFKGILQNV